MGEIAHVQRPVVNWARKRGILCTKFTPMGYRGYPDYQFLHGGRVCFIEFKNGDIPVDPLQEERISQLRSMGFRVAVIGYKDDGIEFLRTYFMVAENLPTRRRKAGD